MSRINVFDVMAPVSNEEQKLTEKIKNIVRSLLKIYFNVLTIADIDLHQEEQKFNGLLRETVHLWAQLDDAKLTAEHRALLLDAEELTDGLTALLKERYDVLVDITNTRERLVSSAKPKSAKKNKLIFNVVTQSQVTKSNYHALGKSRHFDAVTKNKLEMWYQEANFTKPSVEKMAKEVNLRIIQVKNWVSNRKRKEKREIEEIVKEALRSYGLVSGDMVGLSAQFV